MNTLIEAVQVTGLTTGGAALLYAGTVTVVAVTAIAAPSAERRDAALRTLQILLPRRRN